MPKSPTSRLRILPSPTFTGSEVMIVGGRHYGIPEGSIVHLTRESRGRFAWLCTPEGNIHAVTAAGEIAVPTDLREAVRKELFQHVA